MPDVAIPCTKNFWVNMKKMMTGKDKSNTPARVRFSCWKCSLFTVCSPTTSTNFSKVEMKVEGTR